MGNVQVVSEDGHHGLVRPLFGKWLYYAIGKEGNAVLYEYQRNPLDVTFRYDGMSEIASILELQKDWEKSYGAIEIFLIIKYDVGYLAVDERLVARLASRSDAMLFKLMYGGT